MILTGRDPSYLILLNFKQQINLVRNSIMVASMHPGHRVVALHCMDHHWEMGITYAPRALSTSPVLAKKPTIAPFCNGIWKSTLFPAVESISPYGPCVTPSLVTKLSDLTLKWSCLPKTVIRVFPPSSTAT